MKRSKILIPLHLVWTTKHREPWITSDIKRQVRRVIVAEATKQKARVTAINSMPDHVHLAVMFPATISVAVFMKQVKGASSALLRAELCHGQMRAFGAKRHQRGIFNSSHEPTGMTTLYSSELIFPLGKLHSHSSSIVEFPRGQLLVCWYMGSGERKADDVRIMGATKPLKGGTWSKPFVLADTPGFPDTNCVLAVNGDGRLWLFYGTQLDNNWESTLLKYKVGRKVGQWDDMGMVPLKPGDEEFPAEVRAKLPTVLAAYPELEKYRGELLTMADNKLKRRMGWMGRCKPLVEGKRMLLPLYSDGYNFSLVAITDDAGETWRCSKPLIGPGAVQPSLVRRKDGTIAAFCRNNGPAPQRMLVSESNDNGMTWTVATHNALLNPGSSVDILKLKDGRWLLCYNDTENGRHQLAVSVSEDEGKTWGKTQHLDEAEMASKSYPSLLQASDGVVHITYSFSSSGGEAIKHVVLSPP